MLFVNGLPLGVVEVKNPSDEDADIWTAWQQVRGELDASVRVSRREFKLDDRVIGRRERVDEEVEAAVDALVGTGRAELPTTREELAARDLEAGDGHRRC